MTHLDKLEALPKFWRGVVVLSIVAVIVLFFLEAVLLVMTLIASPVHADEAGIPQTEALVVMTSLHNAGLLRDVTLAGELGAAEPYSDPGCRFRLEDVDGSVSDGFASFVRAKGHTRAILLKSPKSALERLGRACQGQAEIAALLRPINATKVARGFAEVLVPEIPAEGWGAKLTPSAAGLGRVSVLLRHREGEIETSTELGLIAVKHDGSWRLEVAGFNVSRVP